MPRTGTKNWFIGRFYHALEQKGRISIPPSFRQALEPEAILTTGLDGCLFLFPFSSWQSVVSEVEAQPFTRKVARDWGRLMANNASSVTFDRLGRILIQDYLRQKANLTKETVIVGSINRVEIWNQTAYHSYLDEIDKNAESIAEKLIPLEI